MKKIIFSSILTAVGMLVMTACGSNSSRQSNEGDYQDDVEEVADMTEAEPEPQEEETGITPPFTVVAVGEGGYDSNMSRKVYTYKIKKDGTYSVGRKDQHGARECIGTDEKGEKVYKYADWVDNEDQFPDKYGEWSTTERIGPNGRQKVYEIRHKETATMNEHADYLPDDFEYIWIPSYDIFTSVSWSDCDNNYTGKAVKVVEVKKD